ncbi:MAG: PilN domain-containing protein [bacterium]
MININLIANRRSRKMREMMYLRWAIFGVFIAILIAIIMNLFAIFDYNWAIDTRNVRQAQVDSLQQKEKQLDALTNQIKELEPQLLLLNQAQKSQNAWLTIMADMSRIIPSNVYLTSFNSTVIDKQMALAIGGVAEDEKTVGVFSETIRTQTSWAGNPKQGAISASVSELTGRQVTFDMVIPIEGMIGGDF